MNVLFGFFVGSNVFLRHCLSRFPPQTIASSGACLCAGLCWSLLPHHVGFAKGRESLSHRIRSGSCGSAVVADRYHLPHALVLVSGVLSRYVHVLTVCHLSHPS